MRNAGLTSPQPSPPPTPTETVGEPTPESLAKLPELVEKMQVDQQSHWQKLRQTMKRREVRNWSKMLHEWAIEYQCQKLLDYANTLQTQLQVFDWHNLPHTIEQFPHIIEEIAVRE